MPKKDNLLITNMNEFSKRLEGYCLNTTDIDGKYLCIGDKVKIYYNIFDEDLPRDQRSSVYGIIKYNPSTNTFYIQLLSAIVLNNIVIDRAIPLGDQPKSKDPLLLSIDNMYYVEIIERSQYNDFKECFELYKNNKIDELKNKIFELEEIGRLHFISIDFINTMVFDENNKNIIINYLNFDQKIFDSTNAVKKILLMITSSINLTPEELKWKGLINLKYLLQDKFIYPITYSTDRMISWICKKENDKYIANLSLEK